MRADRERLESSVGNLVVVDKGGVTESTVLLDRILGDHFGTVHDPEDGVKWDVMLTRISAFVSEGMKQ